MDFSTLALFCEDIREEKAGTETIVGIFPDNLSVPKVPGVFPKICVYLRIHVRPDFNPGSIVTYIKMSDGAVISESRMQGDVVEKALSSARATGLPYAGLITKFVMVQLRVNVPGRISALVNIAGREYVAGALNIQVVSAPRPEEVVQ